MEHSDKVQLGELRNRGLAAVPPGAVWVQWDDDDWRHEQLLEQQMACLRDHTHPIAFLRSQVTLKKKKRRRMENKEEKEGKVQRKKKKKEGKRKKKKERERE